MTGLDTFQIVFLILLAVLYIGLIISDHEAWEDQDIDDNDYFR